MVYKRYECMANWVKERQTSTSHCEWTWAKTNEHERTRTSMNKERTWTNMHECERVTKMSEHEQVWTKTNMNDGKQCEQAWVKTNECEQVNKCNWETKVKIGKCIVYELESKRRIRKIRNKGWRVRVSLAYLVAEWGGAIHATSRGQHGCTWFWTGFLSWFQIWKNFVAQMSGWWDIEGAIDGKPGRFGRDGGENWKWGGQESERWFWESFLSWFQIWRDLVAQING